MRVVAAFVPRRFDAEESREDKHVIITLGKGCRANATEYSPNQPSGGRQVGKHCATAGSIPSPNPNALTLGGHLKPGHTWTLQNRPMEQNQNKSIYTLQEGARAIIFSNSLAARFILALPGRKIRQRRDATGAPTQRPEWLGAVSAAPQA